MEKIKQQLIKSGYKLTKARLVVLEYLYLNHLTVSARKLHQEVKECDQASDYRTLNLFEKLNLVNVEIVNKEKIYCLSEKPHHHIICKKCGYSELVVCNHDFTRFKKFENVSHQLTLIGVCKKCNK